MKKLLVLALSITLLSALLGFGALSSTGASANEEPEIAIVLSPKNHDLKSDWDQDTATKINLNGSSATVDGAGAAASGGVITISAAGTYVVSGILTDGQIVVDATGDDRVHLILNGADITNRTGAAIYAPLCDKLILTLAEGTNNTVTDGGSNYTYSQIDNEEPNAAIFAKNDLTINGAGTLTVNAGFNNGIGTKDDLLIIGGNFIINAANHGLRGNDSIGIVSGAFNITAGSDGIRTNNDTDDEKGWIIVEDGVFDIKAAKDGIQAENTLTIINGVFNITSGGGSANAPARVSERFAGGAGGGGRANGAGGQPPTDGQSPMSGQAPISGQLLQPQTAATETDDESTSTKALKASKQVNIIGGDFTVDAEDDGIHSNGDIFISGGKFSIKTGDDGIHADNAVVVSGGDIDISLCYEGIESLGITISGGNVSIIASDDGLNAAAGESSDIFGGSKTQGEMPQDWQAEEMPDTPQDWQPGERADRQPGRQQGFARDDQPGMSPDGQPGMPRDGQPGMPRDGQQGRPQDGQQGRPQGGQGQQSGGMNEPRFNATEGAFIRISGGNINITASNDGIDSNGHVYIEGGLIKISAPSMGADGAIEMDGNFVLTGGQIIAAGSVYSLTTGSTQPILRVSYTSQQAMGDVITLKDSTGKTLLEYTSAMAYSASGFTSPLFKLGEKYSLFINGEKRLDVTLNELTTSIGEDGGAYSVGRGGAMGGRFW